MAVLPRKFYARDTVRVARDLLGKRIVRRAGRTTLSARIVETEAYRHGDDPASHAFGRLTDRNRAMFGEVGRAYVYFTYGMHYCFNVVARGPRARAGAVLIRAAEPERGLRTMERNRGRAGGRGLTDGPAKLAQAMGITGRHYGADLAGGSEIRIEDGRPPKRIIALPRVGISKATDRLWNFVAQD